MSKYSANLLSKNILSIDVIQLTSDKGEIFDIDRLCARIDNDEDIHICTVLLVATLAPTTNDWIVKEGTANICDYEFDVRTEITEFDQRYIINFSPTNSSAIYVLNSDDIGCSYKFPTGVQQFNYKKSTMLENMLTDIIYAFFQKLVQYENDKSGFDAKINDIKII